MVLTRNQFQQACEAFLRKYETENSVDEFIGRSKNGWQWRQHSILPGLGYMTRAGYVSRRQKDISPPESPPGDALMEALEEEDDDSTLPPQLQAPCCEVVTVQQYIVYSATFQVPAFYFTIHDRNGSPLPLHDILGTSLFRRQIFPQCIDTASHGISMPNSNFPLLSQGDHPVLGTPCWYFHPCETSTAVSELLEAGDERMHVPNESLLRWMEAWFLVLSSVVDIR